MHSFSNKQLGALSVLLFAASCATQSPGSALYIGAADPIDAELQSLALADADPDELICKTTKRTGTRIGRLKDCRTAKNWRQSVGNANRAIETWKNDSAAEPKNF